MTVSPFAKQAGHVGVTMLRATRLDGLNQIIEGIVSESAKRGAIGFNVGRVYGS
jgi:hypothetical protein